VTSKKEENKGESEYTQELQQVKYVLRVEMPPKKNTSRADKKKPTALLKINAKAKRMKSTQSYLAHKDAISKAAAKYRAKKL
jgi:hypothetical protein